jgi:imidazolonepropionase-like amidohydrolase
MRNVLWFLLAAACSFAHAQTLSPEVKQFVKIDAPVIALQHVRIIDGTGAPARDDQTVVLANGKIQAVGDAASVSVSKDAQVLDLHGDSVLPGLVGMHDHMFYPMGGAVFGEMAFSFPRLYLAAGVTTLRTSGSIEPYTVLEINRHIDDGSMPGPKFHATGYYLEG